VHFRASSVNVFDLVAIAGGIVSRRLLSKFLCVGNIDLWRHSVDLRLISVRLTPHWISS